MNSTEMLPEKLPTDSRLTKNQLDEYYLGITETVKVKQKEHSKGLEKVIFIDPGVKKLYTGYAMDLREDSSDGAEFITIGKMDICRIGTTFTS